MKLFHLADLHLGKTLHERDLLEDQRHALEAVVKAAEAERPACVILAGDVFDRAVPPVGAVALLGEFATGLRSACGASLAIIPGNHDSAARLAFLAPVLAEAGVYVASDPELCDRPVRIERDGEAVRLWLLPFLSPGAFEAPVRDEADSARAPGEAAVGPLFAEEAPTLRSQAELFAEAMRRIGAVMGEARGRAARATEAREREAAADVLVCHAFAQGGSPSESERVFLGTAELVDASAFEAFDYVALGHLHRPQSVGTKGRYPGSLLAYSFSEGEVERGFLSVEVGPGRLAVEERALRPLRRMVRLSGRYDDVLADPSLAGYEGDYVEAVLDDAEAVVNPVDGLRRRFPNILSLRQAAFERAERPGAGYAQASAGLSAADDFSAFYTEVRGEAPGPEDLELFAELYEEAIRADR